MSVLYIRGEDGKMIPIRTINGKNGRTPVKGKDYFTSEDVTRIAEEAAGLVEIPEKSQVRIITWEADD